MVGFFGDLRGFVVADFGRQGGHQHQGIFHVEIDLLLVDFDSFYAVFYEAAAGIGQEADGIQEIENDYGLEDIQLEIAQGAGDADGGVIAHHLHGDHGERFGLRGIYFAGHDGRARLVFGDGEFAETAARAGGEPANVVGDFHQGGGQSFQRAARVDELIVRGERGEFIGMRAEGQAGEFGDFLRGALGELRRSIEAGADGGAADGQIVEAGESFFQASRCRARPGWPSRTFPGRR